MADATSSERNTRGEWRPANPIALAPINNWPIRLPAVTKLISINENYVTIRDNLEMCKRYRLKTTEYTTN